MGTHFFRNSFLSEAQSELDRLEPVIGPVNIRQIKSFVKRFPLLSGIVDDPPTPKATEDRRYEVLRSSKSEEGEPIGNPLLITFSYTVYHWRWRKSIKKPTIRSASIIYL